ncbi:MAG: zinc dependent phospholipase C family protein [Dehalococcoidia bacterium]|nr:zinc dependent phospholipase C family protein [Dehalococcoidia bacterium]
MPPITLHMVLARNIARDLGMPQLPQNDGHYLLGATTPDIRVLTRQDRQSTHYFDLNGPDHQDSVAMFLAEHGHLAAPENLNDPTRAWACGYISHLVMDEQYITGIFRRFFADEDALGGKMRAGVMDRLLQFDLDRVYGNDVELTREVCDALACTVADIESGFIDHETMEKWRKVSLDVMSKDMDWDRMRSMIFNHLRFSGLKEGETMTSFLDSLPELLDETIAHITSAEVDGFVQRSSEAAAKAIERYLGCG